MMITTSPEQPCARCFEVFVETDDTFHVEDMGLCLKCTKSFWQWLGMEHNFNAIRKDELVSANNRLKSEFKENWSAFYHTRLKELRDE